MDETEKLDPTAGPRSLHLNRALDDQPRPEPKRRRRAQRQDRDLRAIAGRRPCSPIFDSSRGLFYLEYPVTNGNALHPSGTSVVLGSCNWNTVAVSARWHDHTIAID